jgi:hypothetical protein
MMALQFEKIPAQVTPCVRPSLADNWEDKNFESARGAFGAGFRRNYGFRAFREIDSLAYRLSMANLIEKESLLHMFIRSR